MNTMLMIPAALFGLGMSMMAANAALTNSTAVSFGQAGVIIRVAEHKCVRDERGWHYMENERRHSCRPKRPEGKDWGWRCEGKRCGWWHAKEKRWND
jgi:hypothetical protein